jgi:leucyl-tRNA synthetase
MRCACDNVSFAVAARSIMARKILVTSALPYANASLHLGHIMEAVQTDIWVRFQKMRGNDCIYCCAEDAHGTPIMIRAQQEGITPESLIARTAEEHRRDYGGFLIGFDQFHSTHSAENVRFTHEIYARPTMGRPACSCRTATCVAPARAANRPTSTATPVRSAARPIRRPS